MKLSRRSLLVSAAAVAVAPAAVLAAPSPEIIPTLGKYAAGYGMSAGQIAILEIRLLAAADRLINRPWVMVADGTVDVGESYALQAVDRRAFEALRALHRMVVGASDDVAEVAASIETSGPREIAPGLWLTLDRNG